MNSSFQFSGGDSAPRLTVFLLLFGGGCIPIPFMVHEWLGLYAVLALFVFPTLLAMGLRFSIEAEPGRLVITRKCLGIPYWRHNSPHIEDVFYSGDYGDAEGAIGVEIVLEGGRQIHIGSSKSMRRLYKSLLAFKRQDNDGGHGDG